MTVIFPTATDLDDWVGGLDDGLLPFLPEIDDVWFQEMVSCFQIAFAVNGLHLTLSPHELYEMSKGVAQAVEGPENVIADIGSRFTASCEFPTT